MTTTRPARSVLARLLTTRSAEIVDEVTDLLAEQIDSLKGDQGYRDWLHISTQANIEVMLHLIAHPDDLALAEPPIGAVSTVHRLAHQGLPFYEIVRAYNLAESRWVQICLQQLATLTDDPAVLVSETIALSTLAHAYLDRVCQRIAVEYETERERWRRQEESFRVDRVLALLEGTADDLPAAEAALGYRLRQRHLAVILWIDGEEDSGDALIRTQRAVTAVAELAECRTRPLIVARDRTTVWAWLPLPGNREIDTTRVQEVVSAELPRLRIALGRPAPGLDGFAASHRQAAAAHEIGLASGQGATVIPYREVASLVFLCTDLPRARRWVAETLGLLAVDGHREQELRRTLGAYSASNRSAIATARTLNCHKNTVLYRLRASERLLGYPVSGNCLDLDLALLACRWLGTQMLTTPE
ncbi:PucR family transcriptional regulator [Rhodococcus sp. OK302]|uniref:PucR family transcriptional regulator n=1 Tax=Rhodococcus sp. OK302 TaxID=1882769 RepID=UPI000B9F5A46|nr:helix-turn-helix domain-containing protein [Rhodococcus sp. OK302]OYD60957.1 DNA-binding PucR family transcriptional regulator [Rhodococcus sp. OK302]